MKFSISVIALLDKNYRNQQGSLPNYNNYNNQNNQVLPLNYQVGTSLITLQGSSTTQTGQGSGQALSSYSTWGSQHSYNNIPAVDTRKPPPTWKILGKQTVLGSNHHHSIHGTPNTIPTTAPDNIHSSNTLHKSDLDIKSFVEATSKISETISYGMENPDVYLSIVNEALT